MRTVLLFSLILVRALLTVSAADQDEPRRIVFQGKNNMGEVWANVGLTIQRLEESYIPIVVMVVNHSTEAVTIDRDSIRLVGEDGSRYPMPTLQELRKGYLKVTLDGRAVSGAGIPYEVWQQNRRLLDSNFFPNMMSDRRATVIDEVTLPSGYAMIDLVYFSKPRGLGPGVPFLIEVQPLGWEVPVHLGIVLS